MGNSIKSEYCRPIIRSGDEIEDSAAELDFLSRWRMTGIVQWTRLLMGKIAAMVAI